MANKKLYHAPSAEIIVLMPSDQIATGISKNWLGFGSGTWWGLDNSAWWGKKSQNDSIVTGTLLIPDEDGKNWELPKK